MYARAFGPSRSLFQGLFNYLYLGTYIVCMPALNTRNALYTTAIEAYLGIRMDTTMIPSSAPSQRSCASDLA